jgi:hypothetical protein
MSDISLIGIFPPIGIARLGDSGFDLSKGEPDGKAEIFFSSEIPGTDGPPAVGFKFRDARDRIKRQAVLFHVYAFRDDRSVTELLNDDYHLRWTVHVANKKGAFTEYRGRFEPPTTDLRNPEVQPREDFDDRTWLIVDPGEKSIESNPGENPCVQLDGHFYGSRGKPDSPAEAKDRTVNLGELRTDAEGRLIFVAGAGHSRCVSVPNNYNFQPDIISDFDSIDWVDDICDGWVTVTATRRDDRRSYTSKPATIITAPPKFAWGLHAPTTLYDIIENLADGEDIPWRLDNKVQFYEHIWPILRATYGLSWVNEYAYQGHGPTGKGNFLPLKENLGAVTPQERRNHQDLRDHVFQRLRKPDYQDISQACTKFMPRLSGDGGDCPEPGGPRIPGNTITQFAALTKLQYKRFKKWRDGVYETDLPFWIPANGTPYAKINEAPMKDQPWLLTLAALEHTVGDPLAPGIELGWRAKDIGVYTFSEDGRPHFPPFRVNHTVIQPGHLSRSLSLPWQSDFDLCNAHWWPSIRPDDVINIADWRGTGAPRESVTENAFMRDIANTRRKWDRGIRRSPDYPKEYFPGSTDMVKLWHGLGFVSKQMFTITNNGASLPVFVEDERLKEELHGNHPIFTAPISF